MKISRQRLIAGAVLAATIAITATVCLSFCGGQADGTRHGISSIGGGNLPPGVVSTGGGALTLSGASSNILSGLGTSGNPLLGSISTSSPVTGTGSSGSPLTTSISTSSPVSGTGSSGNPLTASISTSSPVTGTGSSGSPLTTSLQVSSPVTGTGSSGSPLTTNLSVTAPIAGTGSSGSALTWASGTDVSIANNDLQLATSSSPTTPSSGKLAIFSQQYATRQLPVVLGPTANKIVLGQHLGHRSGLYFWPTPASTNVSLVGTNNTTTGTGTARVISSTNLASSMIRIGGVSSATGGGTPGGFRGGAAPLWRGNAAGLGGFYCVFRWTWSDASLVTTGQGFVGLWATTTAPTDVGPETLTNIFGFGNTNGDTHMQLYAAGSSAQARTDLGASFPANTVTTDVYEGVIYAAPNDTQISYQLTRLNTGDTTSNSVSTSSKLFSTTTFVGWQVWRSNGGTASATGVDLISLWCDPSI